MCGKGEGGGRVGEKVRGRACGEKVRGRACGREGGGCEGKEKEEGVWGKL